MSCYTYSSVGIMTRLSAGQPRNRVSIPVRCMAIYFTAECPDGLWGPSSLLFNGYRGFFSGGWGIKGLDRKNGHCPPSIARSRMSGAITSRPHTIYWRGQGQLCFYLLVAYAVVCLTAKHEIIVNEHKAL